MKSHTKVNLILKSFFPFANVLRKTNIEAFKKVFLLCVHVNSKSTRAKSSAHVAVVCIRYTDFTNEKEKQQQHTKTHILCLRVEKIIFFHHCCFDR